MEPTRVFAIFSLIALPTVMYGGYALLRLLTGREEPTEFRRTYFRAGHAHAGVLQILALVYYQYLARTTLADGMQWLAFIVLQLGILAQSGGFFVHMVTGQPDAPSIGTRITMVGAALLAVAMLFLAYALITAYPG